MNPLSRIYHFILGPNPLHPDHWDFPFPAATFKTLNEADIPQCLEIYRLNEKDRFPEGEIAVYERSLRSGESYHLVAEWQGKVISTAGMSYWGRADVVVLCYGMVHPDFQGQGFGTLQTLIRIALLKPEFLAYHVCILGINKSLSFYRRFGFQPMAKWKDRYGNEHPLSKVEITNLEIMKCKKRLIKRGVQFDFARVTLPPVVEVKDQAADDSMVTEVLPL